jgi:BirA family biotin operon repressor/biotin-[acetyl-CoA-carboxylase] ligase
MPRVILEVKGWALEIIFLEEVGSTQRYLLDKLKTKEFEAPICVTAKKQSDGIGSYGRSWLGMDGNLFFSFAVNREIFSDVPLHSLSVYLLYILKEYLCELGSNAWLKWPNDLYLGELKVCGCISHVYKESVVCGIGLNTQKSPQDYAKLDIKIDNEILMRQYLAKVLERRGWKQIFSMFQVEFETTKSMLCRISTDGKKLETAVLQPDGSLMIGKEKVYGAR